MVDLSDQEAAHLGNVARACIRRGTIPPISLRPLWFTNRGRCIGLRIIGHDEDEFDLNGDHDGTDYLEALFPIVQHLKAYAGEVIETPGIQWLLYEWEHTRDIFYVLYPVEKHEWVNLEEAMKIGQRSRRTIQTWAKTGWVRQVKSPGYDTLYLIEDICLLRDNIKMGPKPKKESLPSVVL